MGVQAVAETEPGVLAKAFQLRCLFRKGSHDGGWRRYRRVKTDIREVGVVSVELQGGFLELVEPHAQGECD